MMALIHIDNNMDEYIGIRVNYLISLIVELQDVVGLGLIVVLLNC